MDLYVSCKGDKNDCVEGSGGNSAALGNDVGADVKAAAFCTSLIQLDVVGWASNQPADDVIGFRLADVRGGGGAVVGGAM